MTVLMFVCVCVCAPLNASVLLLWMSYSSGCVTVMDFIFRLKTCRSLFFSLSSIFQSHQGCHSSASLSLNVPHLISPSPLLQAALFSALLLSASLIVLLLFVSPVFSSCKYRAMWPVTKSLFFKRRKCFGGGAWVGGSACHALRWQGKKGNEGNEGEGGVRSALSFPKLLGRHHRPSTVCMLQTVARKEC